MFTVLKGIMAVLVPDIFNHYISQYWVLYVKMHVKQIIIYVFV